MSRPGALHLYYGEGKGKTTAAMGAAIRAGGAGWKVLVVQFLKSTPSAERTSLERLGIPVELRPGCEKFLPFMTPEEKADCIRGQRDLWAQTAARADQFDMIVLDELLGALEMGVFSLDDVLPFLQTKDCEIVVTGRVAPEPLLDIADYASCIVQKKHPYEKGAAPRRGIEF